VGRILIALKEGKIGTLWTPDHVDDLRCENVKSIERKWRAAMAAALLPLQQLQVQQ